MSAAGDGPLNGGDTSPPIQPEGTIVLFFGGIRSGDLGGRAGVDALCDAMRPVGVAWAKGFISVSPSDQIQDLVPQELRGLPVRTVVGDALAQSWSDLFDGSILRDMNGVVGASSWWSGAGRQGGVVADTCSGWTSGEGSGTYGCGGMTDGTWLCCSYGSGCVAGGQGQGMACEMKASVACVGYTVQTSPLQARWCPEDACC